MITEHDLQEAIAECEGQRNPTSSTCMKLAAFYTIRDKMYPKPEQPEQPKFYSGYSTASGPTPVTDGKVEYDGETDFARAIDGMDTHELISIMDELMTTLRAIVPRLYDGVMRKIDPTY